MRTALHEAPARFASAGLLLAVLLVPFAAARASDGGSDGGVDGGSAGPTRVHRDVGLKKGLKYVPTIDEYIAMLQAPTRVAAFKVDEVIRKLELAPDAVVSDLGCGPGVFTLPLAAAVPKGIVYAVDVEPAQLDVVREKLRQLDVRNVVPVLASLDTPHLPPGRFDLVLISDTYHHIEDRVAYLRRLAMVLRPNGRVAVLDYRIGKRYGPPDAHKLPAGVRESEFAAAGYTLLKEYEFIEPHEFEIWAPTKGKR